MTDKNQSIVPVTSLLVIVLAGMVFLVSIKTLGTQVETILTVLIGTFSIATVSSLSKLIAESQLPRSIPVHFDGIKVRNSLGDITDVEYKEVYTKENNWEPTSETLLTQDPSLALAKLRIDIEKELRRISYLEGNIKNGRSISIGHLVRFLNRNDAIDYKVASAIMDVLPACNEAIHGGNVKQEVALTVLEIGEDIIRILKTYPKEKTVSDNKSHLSID